MKNRQLWEKKYCLITVHYMYVLLDIISHTYIIQYNYWYLRILYSGTKHAIYI